MRVPRTARNLASQAGCAGQAGAVTRLPSAMASVMARLTYVPPAWLTSGPTAGEGLHIFPFWAPAGGGVLAAGPMGGGGLLGLGERGAVSVTRGRRGGESGGQTAGGSRG